MSRSKVPAWLIFLFLLTIGMWWLSTFLYTMKWDIMDITLPWQYFIGEALSSGELPLWNPYLKNGFPHMGLSDTWYPISWLIAFIFGVDVWSIQLSYLIHLLIAGTGMFSYLRFNSVDYKLSIALGVSYMFSGFMIGNAQHLGWVIGAAWLPWVFYYFDKLFSQEGRFTFLNLALVCSMLFYGGYPPITIIIFYLLLGKASYTLWKSRSRKKLSIQLSKSFGVWIMLSLVGLVGFADLAPQLNRGEALPLSNEGWGVLTGFFPWEAISSLVIPYAGCSVEGYWGADISLINLYFGWLPVLLVAVTLSTRCSRGLRYFVIGTIFMMIAMSEVFPFRSWLYYFPFFDRFRFPSLFRLFTIFFLLIASGFGFEKLKKLEESRKHVILKRLFFVSIILLGVTFALCILNSEQSLISGLSVGIFQYNIQASFYDKAMVNLSVHSIVIVGMFIAYLLGRDVLKLIPYFIIAEVLIISQFNISETVVHNADPSTGNFEINKFDGKPLQLDLSKPMNDFVDGKWNEELSWFRYNQACITKTPSPGGNSPFSLKKYKEALGNGDNNINNNPLLFLGEIVQGRLASVSTSGTLEVLTAKNNDFSIVVNSPVNTSLVFLQNYYPGWRASVDGHVVDIEIVNTTFMTLPLQSGEHQVSFKFRPLKVVYAYYLSLIAFLIVTVSLFYRWAKPRSPYEPL